jgi:hypothetical protein
MKERLSKGCKLTERSTGEPESSAFDFHRQSYPSVLLGKETNYGRSGKNKTKQKNPARR